MCIRDRGEAHGSLDGKLRRLLWSMLLLVCVILVATLAILLLHNHQSSIVTANIVRASQFNQNFKDCLLYTSAVFFRLCKLGELWYNRENYKNHEGLV